MNPTNAENVKILNPTNAVGGSFHTQPTDADCVAPVCSFLNPNNAVGGSFILSLLDEPRLEHVVS